MRHGEGANVIPTPRFSVGPSFVTTCTSCLHLPLPITSHHIPDIPLGKLSPANLSL